MKTAIYALPLCALASACMTVPTVETASTTAEATIVESQTESARLNEWFAAKFVEELSLSPMRQTALGIKTDYGKIDDFSLAGLEREVAWRRATTTEMESSFNYDLLDAEAKVSWDMWKYLRLAAERELEHADRAYILHQMGGWHTELPTFLLTQHSVESESDMVAFVSRLGAIGRAMDQLLARAQANAAAGTRPPRFAYDSVIGESRKLVSGAPFDDGEASALWAKTGEHLDELVADGRISSARAAELRSQARRALLEDLGPAYRRVIEWYTADLPNVDDQARGVSALTDGQEFYSYALWSMNTTDMTADEIHELGLAEVARIQDEMEAIKSVVGFDGTLREFFDFVREDKRFFFPNDDAGAQAYIDAAEKYLAFIEEKLPQYFGVLPKASLVVRRVEPFREQDGAAQHYHPGTPDGSRPGVYYAHLSDMSSMPIPEIETIAYHEGNPGHHMQTSIAQETTGIPDFRSKSEYIPAFGEGWGLYSEKLAKEMGAFQDPYQDFGRLQNEIWRAIRLVVDTGIHAKGWTEQQAIDYATANSSNPETASRSEVQRYFVLPGQATAYKIGMIKIQQLRAKAERELGERFDIRGFHDTVLNGGDVPLFILEQRIDNWIAETKGG